MAVLRFSGRACIELIGTEDHIIIDPNFVKPPRKGINKKYTTQIDYPLSFRS
ncbi:MAG: hypothetical protein BAJALOKI1v1_1170007 [Promethearchaeota archaeon]|nr:MAG: hypothetical protein BAJALOKI1v1_1170007 [Candidatus Lokiarchaeota archaeon]